MYLPFLLALFVPDFFATVGTILGVGARAGYLDENGNFDSIDQCFQVDAAATSLGALFGMPGMTTYLESSAGIEAGGKTGLTVVFTSICFLLALFLPLWPLSYLPQLRLRCWSISVSACWRLCAISIMTT